MDREVFLDTSFPIAVVNSKDRFHETAVHLSLRLKEELTNLVTTRNVLVEIADTFSRARYRHLAVGMLRDMEADPSIEIVPASEALYAEALELYVGRPDKEWGMTDCMAFVTMEKRGIRQALTADQHFRQAGFQILL